MPEPLHAPARRRSPNTTLAGFYRPGAVARAALAAVAWTALAALALGPKAVQAQDNPLRGGRFEVGLTTGFGSFQAKSGLDSCRWYGLRLGHRFAPFPGNEKLRIGLRTGWEGCLTSQETEGRVDMIHINAGLYFGLQPSKRWLVYWFTGVGELLGDSTPGPADKVEPRFSIHLGPGVTWAFSDRFLLDASLMALIYEGFELGGPAAAGSTVGLVPNLMLGLQI